MYRKKKLLFQVVIPLNRITYKQYKNILKYERVTVEKKWQHRPIKHQRKLR